MWQKFKQQVAQRVVLRGKRKQIKVNLLPCSIILFPPQRVTWRGNRGTSSGHAGFCSSQAALMALSTIYSFGTVSKRTRSGALASSTHLSVSKPIKESRKAKRQKKQTALRGRENNISYSITAASLLVFIDCCNLDKLSSNLNSKFHQQNHLL